MGRVRSLAGAAVWGVVLNGVDRHDGRMREDDRTARRRLSLDATLLDKEGGGAGAGCGEQLPSTEVE